MSEQTTTTRPQGLPETEDTGGNVRDAAASDATSFFSSRYAPKRSFSIAFAVSAVFAGLMAYGQVALPMVVLLSLACFSYTTAATIAVLFMMTARNHPGADVYNSDAPSFSKARRILRITGSLGLFLFLVAGIVAVAFELPYL